MQTIFLLLCNLYSLEQLLLWLYKCVCLCIAMSIRKICGPFCPIVSSTQLNCQLTPLKLNILMRCDLTWAELNSVFPYTTISHCVWIENRKSRLRCALVFVVLMEPKTHHTSHHLVHTTKPSIHSFIHSSSFTSLLNINVCGYLDRKEV